MELMEYRKSYREYKEELDGELQKTAEGFVRIGYLLKVARDTNVLAESGYKSVAEFAEAEYSLDKTQVSRFISINDKFSEGGYSDHLLPEYKGFGYAKLTLMLALPDEINRELSPEYSKSEIQAIKEEVEAEQQVTDIERILEEPMAQDGIVWIIHNLGETEPELYANIVGTFGLNTPYDMEKIKEWMAPAGEKTYFVRIPGIGRMMLIVKDKEEQIKSINTRTNEVKVYSWEEVAAAWASRWNPDETPEQNWERIYGQEFPGKVAPVQQQEQREETNGKKKETKVSKAKPEQKSVKDKLKDVFVKKKEEQDKAEEGETEAPENLHDIDESIPEPVEGEVIEETEEKQPAAHPDNEQKKEELIEEVPGQMQVEDYPELMPEDNREVAPVQQEKDASDGSRITYHFPDGTWGVKGIAWNDIPRALYGALFKLKDYEDCGISPDKLREIMEREKDLPGRDDGEVRWM